MAEKLESGSSVAGSDPATIVYPADRSQVTRIFRDADDLVLHMSNGSIARLGDFFADGEQGRFLLQESDGSVWQAHFAQAAGETVMTGYGPVEVDVTLAESLAAVRTDGVAQEPKPEVSSSEGFAAAADAVAVAPDNAWEGYSIEIQSITDNVGSNQGDYGADATTDDTTPRLNGVAKGMQPGDQIRIYEGENFLGVAEVDAEGKWSFDVLGASDGQHAYTARIVNAAGMESPFSGSLAMVVDTGLPAFSWVFLALGVGGGLAAILASNSGGSSSKTSTPTAPDQTVTITHGEDAVAPQTGSVASGGTTDDSNLTLHGTLDAALGSGEALVVYRDGVEVGRLGASSLGSSLAWSFSDDLTQAGDGSYTYRARVVNGNGLSGDLSNTYSVTLDTSAPDAGNGYALSLDTYTNDVDPGQGNLGDGTVSNDATPTLNGTVSGLESGDYIRVYEGTTLLGTATTDESGNWTFDVSAASEGTHTYTAVVVNAAGNEGVADTLSLTVDTTPPNTASGYTLAIVDYTDDTGATSGNFAGGTTTNDTTPTLNGTVAGLQSGDYVGVFEGETLLGMADLDGSGGWTFEVPTASDGEHTYTAKIVDAAGNEGLNTDLTLTVASVTPISLSMSLDSLLFAEEESSVIEDLIAAGESSQDIAALPDTGVPEEVADGGSVVGTVSADGTETVSMAADITASNGTEEDVASLLASQHLALY